MQPTDRLGMERAPLSRDFNNTALASWEKAAALLGAAISPASTIASMVLAPPAEETIFDRLVTGPDGKQTILPPTTESVVPRMKKIERAAKKPNPIVATVERQKRLGPADPANDVLHQKINDRDFLVHATRPGLSGNIRAMGGIMPSGDRFGKSIVRDPFVKNALAKGILEYSKSPFSGKTRLQTPDETRIYGLVPDRSLLTGTPELEPSLSPGVSLSRQMTVPALNEKKSYRFLVDPKARPTFPTAETGFKKPYAGDADPRFRIERHESEQRTYGTPLPIKNANRAIISEGEPKSMFEEFVADKNVDRYRSTMGNENLKILRERLGLPPLIKENVQEKLWTKISGLDKQREILEKEAKLIWDDKTLSAADKVRKAEDYTNKILAIIEESTSARAEYFKALGW